ncbi:MAG TPA: carbon-nitrogen hydrolase family protein [Candidatus Limnocylindrales bacterium]|nr:carbon-nitrogen hydrolase family protein [Candidatus Limnocylindrales bacterium]
MRAPLEIAAAQPLTVPSDVAGNALRHADAIRTARTRVVVFPEMSLTGYGFDARAIGVGDPRLEPIVDACRRTGVIALVGGPVESGGGEPHIAILAIDGEGVRIAYRKMWLGGAEPDHFRPGTAPAVLEVDGWRLGLAVCKDTGVPQHAADTAALGMDAYVAGVLETMADAAVPDERARRVAADHGVWVVIASFAGSTGGGFDEAAGGSGIWAADGLAVARAGIEPGEIVRATLT